MRVSVADRWAPGRPALLFAVVFVVGIGLGWVITRPFANTPSQHVTTVDYVSVVAQLYQRDHNATVARERLSILGSPTSLVQQAVDSARNGNLREPSDLTALQSLAQALQIPVDLSNVATPAVRPTISSDLAGAGATGSAANSASASIAASSANSSRSSTAADDEHISPVGPVLAFLFAFILGGLVLMRTAGLSLPALSLPEDFSLRLPTLGSMGRTGSRRSFGALRMNDSPFRRPARSTSRLDDAEDVVDEDGSAPMIENPHRDFGRASIARPGPERDAVPLSRPGIARNEFYRSEPRRPEPVPIERIAERPAARGASVVRTRPPAARLAPRRLSFQSRYEFGDDSFDEIHTITDPQTGALVAACGLNCALVNRHGGASRCFAFSAWLQDYVGDDQLHALGLVSPGALDGERDQIDSWAQTSDIAAILPAEPGASAELKTDLLATTINVVEAEYGSLSGIPDAYLTSLVVRFDVQWMDQEG
jgi:hypothetical protein